MELFSRKELIKTEEGYVLVLHLERQTSEFGEEFISSINTKRKELQKDTLEYIKNYVQENYKDIKIDTVKIMLGSLLVASMGYGSIDAASAAAIPAAK